MTIDLKQMSRKELEKLGRNVEKALDKLQKQDLKKVRLEMEKLAAAHGVSVQDVMAGKSTGKAPSKSASKPKIKADAKFANPDDPSQTWTGKGRQPNWYRSAINAGKSPDSMAI